MLRADGTHIRVWRIQLSLSTLSSSDAVSVTLPMTLVYNVYVLYVVTYLTISLSYVSVLGGFKGIILHPLALLAW